jgi:formate hydrogenlyase subunit 4
MLAIAIAENGVLPAGSPGSHLELTMGHHALLLEYSGRHLALLQVSIAKMRVFRVPEFLGVALLLGLLAAVFLFVSQGFA